MASIGLRELSHHTSRIVDRVRHGEVIEVTDHGKPVLRLVPISEHQSLRERLIAEGRLKPAHSPALPEAITTVGPEVSLSETLHEMRDDERY